MIGNLTGKLTEKHPPQIIIDVNGVDYKADVSMQTFYNLPHLNETVQLYTQLVVREDAHLLFGFGTAAERATFRQLVKVSGIDAKTALDILSAMTADELAQAVAQEDVKRHIRDMSGRALRTLGVAYRSCTPANTRPPE